MFNAKQIVEVVTGLEKKIGAGGVAVAGLSALCMYGMHRVVETIRLEASSTAFHQLSKQPGAKVYPLGSQKMLTLGECVIMEGLRLGNKTVNGIEVCGLDGIKARSEVLARRPGADGWAEACQLLAIIEHHESQQKADEERTARLEQVREAAKAVKEASRPKAVTEDEQAFEARLRGADWYYSYSDSLAVYKSGKERCEALQREASEKGGNYVALYNWYSAK